MLHGPEEQLYVLPHAPLLLLHCKTTSSPLPFKNHRRRVKVLWRSRSMEEYNRYVRIADGDPVKLARMLEIQSWFDNKDQLAAMATSKAKYLQQSEKAVILPEGVARENMVLLLSAMEQTDSPNPIVRERWWEYRCQMEHPPEIEGSNIYRVPFCVGDMPEQAGGVFTDRTQL